jgi:hypothetical protein
MTKAISVRAAAARATKANTLVASLGGLLMVAAWAAALGAAPVSGALAAEQAASPADVAAATAIAAQARQNAGQFGATRTMASHFADVLESHHYPAAKGDGPAPKGNSASLIAGGLAMFTKAMPDFKADERISQNGNVVTVTAFTTGSMKDGGKFEDVSMISYVVHDGAVIRADAVHTNPSAAAKALAGSDARYVADHATAEKVAAAMRATGGDALLATPAFFADRVAVWSPDALQSAAVFTRDQLHGAVIGENAMLKKAIRNYANADDIKVEGNTVVLDAKTTGALANGEPTWTDVHAVLYVTDGMIVGLQASHSPGAHANMAKIMSKAG